jgi:hypothetical protein
MDNAVKDDRTTIAAIGLLAYLSTDVAHHVLGHGGACLATGGVINLLSSVFVDCSIRGSVIDLSGPFANLIVGLISLLLSTKTNDRALKLFWILATAFNLFWFELQTTFSAFSRTDDWAWAIQQSGVGNVGRYALIAIGLIAYRLTIQLIARHTKPYASSESRVRSIMIICWISAGLIALATAIFDHNPANAIWHHALPQSMLLSIGLLFVPKYLTRIESIEQRSAIKRSTTWIVTAAIMSIASIALLGRGIQVILS